MNTFFTKPTLYCQFVHQYYWDMFDTDAAYCKQCEVGFMWPSKQKDYPVYRSK